MILPIGCHEKLGGQIAAKLAPVDKLLIWDQIGFWALKKVFGENLQLFCAKVNFQPLLSAPVAKPENKKLQKQLEWGTFLLPAFLALFFPSGFFLLY